MPDVLIALALAPREGVNLRHVNSSENGKRSSL